MSDGPSKCPDCGRRIQNSRAMGNHRIWKHGYDPRAEHGTYARYQLHKRDGEEACTKCLAATRAYMRRHRREVGETSPLLRAYEALAAKHPQEFSRLVKREEARAPEKVSV